MDKKPARMKDAENAQPSSRVGKRAISGHFHPKVAHSMKIIAAVKDTTMQVVLAEAINDYLEKNGYERLADETPLPRGAPAHTK